MNTATVKALLGITVSTYDSRITALIPVVLDWVKGYCRNTFTSKFRRVTCTTITFQASTKTILIDATSKASLGLKVGDEILIDGPVNSGNYIIDTLVTGGYTVTTDVIDEVYQGSTVIAFVNYPPATQLVISKLIWYDILTPEPVKQKSLGDESKTYYDGYPVAMLEGLVRKATFA